MPGAANKVAVVTGASSGIGRATAELLAARGYQVFGFSRRSGETGAVNSLTVDVRSDESVGQGVEKVMAVAGRIDVLVNAAGYSIIGAIEESSTTQAEAIFNTNLFGTIRVTRAVLPRMRSAKYGRIVNIGSVVGFLPAPFMGLYSATKHALEGYTESLDHEVRRFGVRAIIIEPGYTKTPIAQAIERADLPDRAYQRPADACYRLITDSIANGMPAAAVAKVILKAIRSAKPKIRYTVGPGNQLISKLRRFLPAGIFDKELRRRFQLDRP